MDKFAFASYGHWIFFRYLSEKFSTAKGGIPTIVLDIWKAADSSKGAATNQYSTQAINTALAGRGTSFARRVRQVLRRQPALALGLLARARRTSTRSLLWPTRRRSAAIGQGGTITTNLKHLTSATFQTQLVGRAVRREPVDELRPR